MAEQKKTKEEIKELYKWNNSLGYGTKKKAYPDKVKSFSLIDHKAYVFYRDNSKLASRKTVAHYVEYGKLIGEFYKILGDELVESEGGAYIKGLGYFSVMRYFRPGRTKLRMQDGQYGRFLNIRDDWFFTYFVPISKNNRLRLYIMDNSYYRSFREKLYAKLIEGKIYSCNASLFLSNLRKKHVKYKAEDWE